MSIEKRIIAGQEVGYNTQTRSFCNLPKDLKQTDDDEYDGYIDFNAMADEQLAEYARSIGVDISRCTTRNGVITKLEKAEQERRTE